MTTATYSFDKDLMAQITQLQSENKDLHNQLARCKQFITEAMLANQQALTDIELFEMRSNDENRETEV